MRYAACGMRGLTPSASRMPHADAKMAYANIVSTGMYVPEIEISNDTLRQRFDKLFPEFVDKMEASSGTLTRWYAPEDWATSDLAARAARQALERAGRKPEEVDLVIVGTDSP